MTVIFLGHAAAGAKELDHLGGALGFDAAGVDLEVELVQG
jgi:hypothetical protein